MSTAVVISRMDQTRDELRALAAKSNDADQARRLAITMIVEGPRGLMPRARRVWTVRRCATGASL
jgi:hypothetical protein